jgi:4-oxalocrotonate tautomerase
MAMPLVTIKIIEGRNIEQKRGMVRDVTQAIVKNIDCLSDAVHIDIIEMKRENISQGGTLFYDSHR